MKECCKLKVIIVEPEKIARVAEIEKSLESMQKVVGGCIEALYPFDDYVAIVCNEEGKCNGLPLNRGISTEEYGLYEIIAGTFFICGCDGADFSSLTDEQIGVYLNKFKYPEMFIKLNGVIKSIKYNPTIKD